MGHFISAQGPIYISTGGSNYLSAIGFALQARDSLSSGSWTTIASGTNRVNIDLSAPARFYRLIKQ